MGALTKADLVEILVTNHAYIKVEAIELVDAFFDVIAETLIQGEAVKLSGFGNFTLRDKKSRPGRNPKTGVAAIIEARRVVTFRPGLKLRAIVNRVDKMGEDDGFE